MPRSKNEWSYISTPPTRLHGVVLTLLKKAQGKLYLYFSKNSHSHYFKLVRNDIKFLHQYQFYNLTFCIILTGMSSLIPTPAYLTAIFHYEAKQTAATLFFCILQKRAYKVT